MPGTPNTHERLVPDEVAPDDVTGRKSMALHMERYSFASRHARGTRLLDLACGAGYGTRLVADEAACIEEAVGVDSDAQAIEYARARYGRCGVEFIVGEAFAFDDPVLFDTIVSLETLEHLAEPERFVARLVKLLRPGGVLVASAPTTPSADINPYHLHDFGERSFFRMFEKNGLRLQATLRQRQRYRFFRTLARHDRRLSNLRSGLLAYYVRHPRSVFRRAAATLRFGTTNHYMTAAWRLR